MFKATAQDGLARCGLLVTKHSSIHTPAAMLYTRRGGCLFLTPDLMEKLRPEAQVVQVNTMQFINMPSPEILQSFGRSIHQYLGISSWPVIANNRDPTMAEYLTTKPSNNTGAYVTTYTGGALVTPERYMQAIAALQPDIFVALADEVPGDSRPKRVTQSVDRTIKWLDECLERHQVQQQQQQAEQQRPAQVSAAEDNSGSIVPQQLFAPVVGAGLVQERERSAKAAADRAVAGFALCGFGMGESTSMRPALLEAALRHLPPDKPRLISGLASPVEVLDAVAQGIDLFDCSYPTHATSNGYALSFPLHHQDAEKPGAAAGVLGVDVDAGADDTKLNLWSLQHRAHSGPLVTGCSCFTCRNHSRAYIHHLLHTHEMLASVLLEMHNTHWWLGFFAAIQEAIRAGQLHEYISWFKHRKKVLQASRSE